jgi:uncharacterized membrane protein YphA (DoxX/SURF4 family)
MWVLIFIALLFGMIARFGARSVPFRIRAIRLFLGIIYFTAGMSKVIDGFPGVIGPVWLEDRLAPYGLGLFARFIAVSEIGIGVMLLTRRFATLGAIALVPMQVCILMVTISLHWRGTPFVLLSFLLLNAVLLAYDYPKWKFLLLEGHPGGGSQPPRRPSRGDVTWIAAAVLLLVGSAVVSELHVAIYAVAAGCLVLFGYSLRDWWRSRAPA